MDMRIAGWPALLLLLLAGAAAAPASAQTTAETSAPTAARTAAQTLAQPSAQPPTQPPAQSPGSDVAQRFALCVACHGDDGRSSAMPQYPKIGGQNEAYLAGALKAYRAGQRQGGLAPMMVAIAKPLSDDEIAELARHVSRLAAEPVR